MRILLFNPPFYRFIGLEQDYVPLSLLAVGSQMANNGHEVYLKNLEVGKDLAYRGYAGRSDDYDKYINSIDNDDHPIWKEAIQVIEDVNPDQIGISVLNVKHRSALHIIKIARDKNIPVMVGGSHPTISLKDYPKGVKVMRGEYESRGKRIHNLDDTPLPNYDILMDKYSSEGYAHLLTSRGCPYSCRFCASNSLWHRKLTYKSVGRILKEMEIIYNRFRPNHFTFWDEVFTVNRKRLAEFCSRYDLPAKWRCDTRADVISDEMVAMMKKAGCDQMSIGVECASDATLKYIGKHERRADFVNAAEILNRHNIQWKAYCMIGFPNETEEDIRETLRFTKSLKPFRITLSFFTPYIGTDMFAECKRLGLITDNYDTALYSHQSPYNHFCPKIPKERFIQLRQEISEGADDYNKKALKVWC
jgi:radical SAM superfamily enzyme YgiQ (UPF0313 family)